MKLGIGLALALLCGCAATPTRPPAKDASKNLSRKDAPVSETRTFGPSRVIYWR
jgi:hypothetical protein